MGRKSSVQKKESEMSMLLCIFPVRFLKTPKPKSSEKLRKVPNLAEIHENSLKRIKGKAGLDDSLMLSFLSLQSEEEVDLAGVLGVNKEEGARRLAEHRAEQMDSDFALYNRA